MEINLNTVVNRLSSMRNTFIPTVIVVWCVLHWRLIMILMTFGDEIDQHQKIFTIHRYIKLHNGYTGMVLKTIVLSLFSMFIFFVLMLLYEALYLAYTRYGRIFVTKKIAPTKLALQEQVIAEQSQQDMLFKEIEAIQKTNANLISSKNNVDALNSTLMSENVTLQLKLKTEQDEILKLRNSVKDLQSRIGALTITNDHLTNQVAGRLPQENYPVFEKSWDLFIGQWKFAKNPKNPDDYKLFMVSGDMFEADGGERSFILNFKQQGRCVSFTKDKSGVKINIRLVFLGPEYLEGWEGNDRVVYRKVK